MFNEIEKSLNALFDSNLPKIHFKIDSQSKSLALRLFFKLLKRYDPESCYITHREIASLRKELIKKFPSNKAIRYLMKLISFVYTNPFENFIIDRRKGFVKQKNLFEEFHDEK